MSGSELRYEFTDEGLDACLGALGTTPDDIAAKLSALGFKGAVSITNRCPIALYVEASFEDVEDVDVQIETDNELYVRITSEHGELADTFAPAAAYGFVLKFDLGDFPGLIEGGPIDAAA